MFLKGLFCKARRRTYEMNRNDKPIDNGSALTDAPREMVIGMSATVKSIHLNRGAILIAPAIRRVVAMSVKIRAR
ncbi:hypothetical protein D9M69_548200 [compost metagenome]